ncbi:MAG: hypothetical protein Q7S18_01240 [bacterium]|nr:hypothetical protein [bacterium]
MKYIHSKSIFLSIVLVVLALVTIRLIELWSFPDTTWILKRGEKIALESNDPLMQKFAASRNNLSGIEILFSSSDIKPGGAISMKILDENCSRILREKEMKVKNLDAENTYSFRFSRIPKSEGKIYCLALSFAPLISPNGKKAKIFLNDVPPFGSQLLNSAAGEKFENKSLAIRPAYQNDSLWKNIDELNQRISQYKPWFLKHYFLYAIIFTFIIFSIVLLVILIAV